MPKLERLSETTMNGYYQEAARQMAVNNYKPDVVVGIMRGGVDFSNKLSHYFSVPGHAITWQNRDGGIHEGGKLNDILTYYTGREVLIVDDIVDSGNTFNQIANFVSESNSFAYVSYAAAIYNQDTDLEVDYIGRTISRADEPQWFEFPWENWWS